MAVRVFMSSGTGWLMISLKNFFAEFDLALPQHPLIRALRVPPKLTPVGDGRGNELLTVLVFVDSTGHER